MRKQEKDPDEAHIRSFQRYHDRRSFEMLYDKYNRDIFMYCVNYLNDEEDAADCAQEIFIRVFRSISSFRFESLFSTWLFRITINNCHSYGSRRKKFFIHHDDDKLEGIKAYTPDPYHQLSGKEVGEVFQKALSHLREAQRNIIILRDIEGKSYEEIAKISRMNPGTVRSTLARARYKMAALLKEYKNGM